MDQKDWLRIRKNWKYLKKEVQFEDGGLLNSLYEKGILIEEEYKKIKKIDVESEQTEQLLFALKSKPPQVKAFKQFCESLKETQPHITDALEATLIPEEDSYAEDSLQPEDVIQRVLLEKFVNKKGTTCKLPEVKKVISEEMDSNGIRCDWNEGQLRKFIHDTFTNVTCSSGAKHEPPTFRNLGIKEKDKRNAYQEPAIPLSSAEVELMTVTELCNYLHTTTMAAQNIQDITEICLSEHINGEVFLSLTEADIYKLFSSLHFGQRRSLELLISKLKSTSQTTGSNVAGTCRKTSEETESKKNVECDQIPYQETLRKFDNPVEGCHGYIKGRTANSGMFSRGNMMHPIRHFIHFTEPVNLISKISEITVAFSAACMNERINGTVYFGISSEGSLHLKPGEIVGYSIDKEECVIGIRQKIRDSFSPVQHEIASKVIRDPQFIEVIEGAGSHQVLYVIEIDVVPTSNMVKNEVFSVKSKFPNSKKNKSRMFRYKDENITRIEGSDMANFGTKVHELTTLRASQEELINPPKHVPDKRKSFLNLFTGGSEIMEDDVYIIALFSPLSEKMDFQFISDNFSFVKEMDTTAIFDFDPQSDTKGLYHYVESEDRVLQVLTTDNFDKNGEENQQRKEKYGTYLENIRFTSLKTWTFCNGYECMNKRALSPYDWKQKRIEGFRGAVQFYYDDIPQGRAMVLVFLFSENYEVMLEAADEIFTKFKDQWIIIAENESTAKLWKEQMVARHCANPKTLEERCVFGIPWGHLNETICQVINPGKASACYLPTSTGMQCQLRERVKQDMCDLDILSTSQCTDSDIVNNPDKTELKRREVEEKFFRGGEVEWWNLWFSDDHVAKRDCHKILMDEVRSALTSNEEIDNKVSVVTLLHQPGAGGTTTSRQILWDLKDDFRCCVVKRITEQTSEQITSFRSYEDPDHPRPPLVLIDNEDDEKVNHLHAVLEDKARKAARSSENPLPVFCVILFCQRRSSLPIQNENQKVQLKHELTKRELVWFEIKSAALEKKYKEDNQVNPKYLISFNILKENFSAEYVQRTVKTLVRDIEDEKEKQCLKYLSLINTYDTDFNCVPVACFDPVMQKQKGGKKLFHTGQLQRTTARQRGWETCLSSPLRVLLNRSSRSTGKGSKKQSLRIINYIMAREILSNLKSMLDETIIDIMNELLDSEIFLCESAHSVFLMNIIKNIIKKRCYIDDRRAKFSPFILSAMKDVDIDSTADIMIKVFDLSEDAVLAQQIARFYMHCKNWSCAEYYAKIATNKMYRNSYFWDTYAMVFKEQLFEEYTESSKTKAKIDDERANKIIKIAFNAIGYFRKEQTINEEEKTAVNNAGYFGEIRVILLLLSIFPKFQCYKGKDEMHRFLVDDRFVPQCMRFVGDSNIDHLKRMQTDALKALRRLDEEFHQLKGVSLADFVPRDPHLNRDCLIKLKGNLDDYFGEASDTIPPACSPADAMEHRRRRVRSLGVASLADALRLKQGKETLLVAYKLMLENVKNHLANAFDFVTILNLAIAYSAITKESIENVCFQQLIDWSNRLYDLKQQQGVRPYLETFMYLILFNLPTDARYRYKLCNSSKIEESIKLWREAFRKNHPRHVQKDEERYFRRKDTTYFFLGNGQDMEEIVYYEELPGLKGGKPGFGDRLWRTEEALNRFRRMKGVLLTDGTEISMQLASAGGNKFNVAIPTSLPVTKRALWQKTVFFVLGFGWSGPKAYDVTDEEIQNSPRVQTSQIKRKDWNARYRPPAVTRRLEDIMKNIMDTEEKLAKITRFTQGAKPRGEKETLKKQLSALERERDDLLGVQ